MLPQPGVQVVDGGEGYGLLIGHVRSARTDNTVSTEFHPLEFENRVFAQSDSAQEFRILFVHHTHKTLIRRPRLLRRGMIFHCRFTVKEIR